MSALQFDATKVAPQGDRTPVPEGEYSVILKSSELKKTPDGTGTVMACTFQIVDGVLQGQTIFNNLNIHHSNAMAQQIGQERLSALCHCVGVLQIQDTTQLHGRPLRVKVIISKQDARFNDIVAFLRSDGSPAAGAAQGSGPSAAPAWATAPAGPATPAPAPAPAPVPAPVAPAPVAPAPVTFPPAGWTAHPSAPGYYYQGQEVKSEADLRASLAPPAAPAPVAPAPAPAPVYTPPPAQGAPPPPAGAPPWMQPQG